MKGSQSREVDGILLHTIIKLFSGLLLLMYAWGGKKKKNITGIRRSLLEEITIWKKNDVDFILSTTSSLYLHFHLFSNC